MSKNSHITIEMSTISTSTPSHSSTVDEDDGDLAGKDESVSVNHFEEEVKFFTAEALAIRQEKAADSAEADNQFDFNPMSITTEDADPFALVPKVEPCEFQEGQDSSEGHNHINQSPSPKRRRQAAGTTTTEADQRLEEDMVNIDDGGIKCLICNRSSKKWPNRRLSQKQQLAGCLCKLFGLSSLPYETDFFEAEYCPGCHKKVLEVGQMFKSLERIQNSILETRIQLEKQISESSIEVLRLTGEILGNLSQGQLRMQEIRKKVVDKLGLSEAEPEIDNPYSTDHSNDPQNNEMDLRFETKDYEPLIVKSPIMEPTQKEAENDSDDWTPESPIGMELSDCNDSDSDYQPSVGTKRKSARHSNKIRVGSSKKMKDSVEGYKKPSRIRGVQDKKRKILIVKLEKLTDEKLTNCERPKRLKTRQKAKSAKSPVLKVSFPKTTKTLQADEDKQDAKFRCHLCNRRCPDELRLTAHVKRFHEGLLYPYSCDYQSCSKTFKTLVALDVHKIDHSKEMPFVCDFCGRGCKTKILLEMHQKNKHTEGAREFKCDKCDRSFITIQHLKSHDLSHTKAYPCICEICGKGFAMSCHLKVHVAAKHSEDNPFTCDYENCGKSFCNKLSMEQHQFIHTKNYPLFCSICGMGQVAEYALRKHMRRVHKEEKDLECEICHKKFKYTWSITKHMMSHKGIKNFECDQCDKKFIDRYKLNRHKRLHTGDRPYQCSICHKCFFTKDYLNTHVGYHNKASEQGKETINQAKIKRTIDIGVSGAKGFTGRTSKRNLSKVQSKPNQVDALTLGNDGHVGDTSSSAASAIHPVTSSTIFPVPASASATSGDVFFQGEFYHIFP